MSREKASLPGDAELDGSSGPSPANSGQQYLMSGSKLSILIGSLCLALFLIGLDTAIISTAIPKITERFNSTKDVGWYGAAYFLALCSLQPLTGKIYSIFSLKWTFLGFFAIFELGSLLCGVAVSSKMLIVARAVAGAGGAGIVSGIMTILAHVIPLEKRAGYMALGGATFGMSTISGPLIGGSLTQQVSWRWCFYLNLPIGGAVTFALVALFHPPIRPTEQRPFLEKVNDLDLVGAFLFLPTTIMALLALQWGGNTYPWHSAQIIGLFCGSGVLLIIFIAWQLHMGSRAMIPPELLTRRTVISTCLTSMCVFGSTFVVVYYLPEWFQVIKAASPLKSGVMNIALFVPQIIGSIIAGTMITKLGYCNPWILAGTILSSVAAGMYSTFKVDTGHAAWIGYQVLNGIGMGFSMETPLTAVQTVLKLEEAAVGISLVTFFQFFGAAIFLAIAQSVFSNQLISQLAQYAPGLDAKSFLQQGTIAVRKIVPPAELPGVLFAYNRAITSTFYVAASASAVGFVGALLLEWNSVKPPAPAQKTDEEKAEAESSLQDGGGLADK